MQFKHIFAATSIAVFAMGAQATSSMVVSVNNFGASSTGGFSWLTQLSDASITLQDQQGWVSASEPNWLPAVSGSGYNTLSLTSANGAFGSVEFNPNNSYSIKLTTPATGAIGRVDLSIFNTFSLAAHSSVTFSWDRTATGTNSGSSAAGAGFSYSNALVLLSSGNAIGYQVDAEPVYNIQPIAIPGSFSIMDYTRHQSMTYTNDSANAITGAFQGSVVVYSQDAVATAVPEPEGYALALAGLLTVGFLSRKRRG